MIGDCRVAVATLAAPYYAAALPAAAESASAGLYNTLATPPPGAASPANRGHGQRLCPMATSRLPPRAQADWTAAVNNTPIPWGWKPSCAPKRDWAWRWAIIKALDSGANSDFRFRQQRLASLRQPAMGEFLALAADAFIASNAYRLSAPQLLPWARSAWRSESGKPTVNKPVCVADGRYHWQYGDWTLSPMLGLAYENIRVNGYGEMATTAPPCALAARSELAGKPGWAWTWPPAWAAGCHASAEWVQRLSTRRATLDAAIKEPARPVQHRAGPPGTQVGGQLRLGSQGGTGQRP